MDKKDNKLVVELHEYSHSCSDGCCTDYGTMVKVNGVELPFHNTDTYTIVEQILKHLGYDVEMKDSYDFDE